LKNKKTTPTSWWWQWWQSAEAKRAMAAAKRKRGDKMCSGDGKVGSKNAGTMRTYSREKICK